MVVWIRVLAMCADIVMGFSPDLRGFFKMYHTRCESVRSEVKLHKEFCTVSFTLVDEHYESPYDIDFTLSPKVLIFRHITEKGVQK